MSDTKKRNDLYLDILILLILIFTNFIWFGHAPFKTIMGDDLELYKRAIQDSSIIHFAFNGSSKLRPVFYIFMYLPLKLFSVHYELYFVLNVIISCFISSVFYFILKSISKNRIVAAVLSILLITARFSFYNIYQIFGPLESLSLLFCILSLYFILKYSSEQGKVNDFIFSQIFNLLMVFTHERYIVMVPVYIIAILFKLNTKYIRKIFYSIISTFPTMILFFLKLFIFKVNPLEGTGGSTISLNVHQVIFFIKSGILNMLGFNDGPVYLSGINLSSVSTTIIGFTVVGLLLIFILLILYFYSIKEADKSYRVNNIKILITIITAIIVLILSSSITIRQEYRWLYTPYAVFLIFIASLFSVINGEKQKYAILLMILLTSLNFICNVYFASFKDNIYFMYSNTYSDSFKDIISEKYNNIDRAYVLNNIDGIDWILGGQDFLRIYSSNTDAKTIYVNDFNNIPKTESFSNAIAVSGNLSTSKMEDHTDEFIEKIAVLKHFSSVAMNFVGNFSSAIIEPNNTKADTPSGNGSFMMPYRNGVKGIVILSGFSIKYNKIKVKAGSILYIKSALVYDKSDGARLNINAIDKNGKKYKLLAKEMSYTKNLEEFLIPLTEFSEENIDLQIYVDSPSGDAIADWIIIPYAVLGIQ